MNPNLPFFEDPQGGKGNRPQIPVTFKARAAAILRAYALAPTGGTVEAVFRALASLNPPPTYPEAAKLAEGVPEPTRSHALNRFRTAYQGAEDRQGCADGGRGHYDPCQCPGRFLSPKGAPSQAVKDQAARFYAEMDRKAREARGEEPGRTLEADPPKSYQAGKTRALRVLRAYIGAPVGMGVGAVFLTLTTLEPIPTYREAAQLVEKIPAQVGARALARFFAFLQAIERIEAQLEGGGGWVPHKPAQALETPDRTAPPDWVPVRDGGAA